MFYDNLYFSKPNSLGIYENATGLIISFQFDVAEPSGKMWNVLKSCPALEINLLTALCGKFLQWLRTVRCPY